MNTDAMMSLGQVQRMQNRMEQQKSRVESGNEMRNSRLEDACKDFQALFVKQMLDSMRKTVNKQGLLNGGRAEEIFEDMLYDKYAEKISENAGLGLDKMLYQQLSQQKPSL